MGPGAASPALQPVPLLTVRGLGKSYAAPVLQGIDLDLRAGEVHALVGENGAGKSTFCRILAGLTGPDAGAMTLRGQPYRPRSKAEAGRCGVRLVLQELNLIGTLTVAESIGLGHLPHRWGWIDRRRLHAAARVQLQRVGLGGLDPSTPVHTLGIGPQQLVEIAAGLSEDCALLILDEPTAALAAPEIEHLFAQIDRLRSSGTCVLYVSHRLEEIRRISDRISVLRDGRRVSTRETPGFAIGEVVRAMVGRDVGETAARTARAIGPVALRVAGLRRGTAVQGVSFEVHRGEILGLAGLMGSGRTETLRAVVGADRPDGGAVFVGDPPRRARIRSPRDAVRHGIALVTENRKEEGLLLPLPIRANIGLPSWRRLAGRGGWLEPARETAAVAPWIRRLDVRCVSAEQRVLELSGGNQQKVLLARWLLRDGDVLLFDEPTRGIDVGARQEIHRWLDQLAAAGKALVVVSSDLRELLALCDRIAVLSAGRLAAVFQRGEWTEDAILQAALSGYLSSPAVPSPRPV